MFAGRALLDRGQEIAHGVHLGHRRDGEADAEDALDAQHQLGAAEAVDAEIAIETARQRNVAALEALRSEFAHEFAHDREQLRLTRWPIEIHSTPRAHGALG